MSKTCIIICAFLIALSVVFIFAGICSTDVSANNRSIGFGEYDFEHIHIFNGIEGHCATVERWYDTETAGIEVSTKEYGSVFCSEGSYILFETSKCPFCGGK